MGEYSTNSKEKMNKARVVSITYSFGGKNKLTRNFAGQSIWVSEDGEFMLFLLPK